MLIETKRLIIREFTRNDLDGLFGILSDPEVMRYSLVGPRSREASEKFLDDMINAYPLHPIAQYAVVLKKSNKLIGFSGFFTLKVNDKEEVELSYRLAKRYWGKGYGTEAALACLDYAFSQLNLKKLVAGIEPANIASIRVAEKVGMKLEQELMYQGKVPVLIYAIENPNLSEDF